MEYKFITEMGAVISNDNDLLTYVEGTLGSVDFPEEFIWQLHKAVPGFVGKLAHTHPPGMTELSSRDELTMKAWAFALYPFPIRMSTITLGGGGFFIETTYLGLLEPKEIWIKKGKKERTFEIIKEHTFEFVLPYSGWLGLLVKKSYGE